MFGVLRDARSLDVLCHAAESLGEALHISLRGILSETDIPAAKMEQICRRLPNVSFGGSYRNPQDLPDIYGKVHFVWASDFLDPGGNSEWCLTNRIYEGGLMGAVLLGARDNATGRMIEEHGLGFTFAEPLGEALAAFLRQIDAETYSKAAIRVKDADPSLFTDMDDTKNLLRELADLAKGAPR
jgi:succinoglycan biosynthesis protein ExoL